jgi:hypothetical protein
MAPREVTYALYNETPNRSAGLVIVGASDSVKT